MTCIYLCSPAQLFARKNGMYTEVADVLVTSDCLSQDIDEKMVSCKNKNNGEAIMHACTNDRHCLASRQAQAVALKSEDEHPMFDYKEWACSVGGPEPWEDNGSPLTSRMNTGVTFFRSTAGGMAMARRWIKRLVVGNTSIKY